MVKLLKDSSVPNLPRNLSEEGFCILFQFANGYVCSVMPFIHHEMDGGFEAYNLQLSHDDIRRNNPAEPEWFWHRDIGPNDADNDLELLSRLVLIAGLPAPTQLQSHPVLP